MIEALAARYGDHGWKAADAAKDLPPALWADVIPQLERDVSPSPNAVGYWLRQRRDRRFGRWLLEAVSDRNGVNDWRLTEIAGDAGHAGDGPPGASETLTPSAGEREGNGAKSPQAGAQYPPYSPPPDVEVFDL